MRIAICSLLVLVPLLMSGLHIVADDSESQPTATTPLEEKVKPPRRKPLPAHYGKLGLSTAQREEVYAIQDSYEKRLEKLREEFRSLMQERNTKVEKVLTSGQKLRLQELREASASKSSDRID